MKKSRLPKPRIWGKEKAVRRFSLYIRARDGQCQFPGCQETENLQNSHYIGRKINATTFDPENCVALCRRHHYGDKLIGWEFAKQQKELHGRDGEYTVFMRKKLGKAGFEVLIARGKTSIPKTRAIIQCMVLCS